MEDNELQAARDLIDFARATDEQRTPSWQIGVKESARILECYMDGTDASHEAKPCERKGCTEEASRWYDDPQARDGKTMYVCIEHDDVAFAEESGDATIMNSAGQQVEVGVYACSEECRTCNQ
jgi:hypothetical protein